MRFPPLIKARFLSRLNRFVCEIQLGSTKTTALLRNTGRLKELLVDGREVFVREKSGGKHAYELLLVRHGDGLVCVDSHLPPKLLSEYLEKSRYPWIPKEVRFEFTIGGSRFDMLINRQILVETKSVNLVREGVALFPDAPTVRGSRHVEELIRLRYVYSPSLVFVIQREDAQCFSPNREVDPLFGKNVAEFVKLGLPVYAFLCRVTVDEIYIWKEIPVRII